MMRIGFVGFGEVNTPRDVIERKCADAFKAISVFDAEYFTTAPVSDDEGYVEADRAVAELSGKNFDALIVCIAGWIPTHAVIRVIDKFRHIPMVLWGLCGWKEDDGRIVSTADQAGTTALRFTMQEMHYKFKYVYSVIGKEPPIDTIKSYVTAAYAARKLRDARIGTMGYRDMLLYGTMYDGLSLRREIGIEVEPFEMLEIYIEAAKICDEEVRSGIKFVRDNFIFVSDCTDEPIEQAVRYAIAISNRIKRRGYDAISLIDVDGMKKLLGIPPAMIFMLIDLYTGASTVPENDIMGSATQLMVKYATGQIAAYAEFYEFFDDTVLMGVPDFIPREVTLGDAIIKPSAFGLLSTSLLNVSKYKDGQITLSRLIYTNGKYVMHLMRGEAKQPPKWEECGWDQPAPQLPSLEVKLDCHVREFADKVASQHIIVSYGDNYETIKDLCSILGIEVI